MSTIRVSGAMLIKRGHPERVRLVSPRTKCMRPLHHINHLILRQHPLHRIGYPLGMEAKRSVCCIPIRRMSTFNIRIPRACISNSNSSNIITVVEGDTVVMAQHQEEEVDGETVLTASIPGITEGVDPSLPPRRLAIPETAKR